MGREPHHTRIACSTPSSNTGPGAGHRGDPARPPPRHVDGHAQARVAPYPALSALDDPLPSPHQLTPHPTHAGTGRPGCSRDGGFGPSFRVGNGTAGSGAGLNHDLELCAADREGDPPHSPATNLRPLGVCFWLRFGQFGGHPAGPRVPYTADVTEKPSSWPRYFAKTTDRNASATAPNWAAHEQPRTSVGFVRRGQRVPA